MTESKEENSAELTCSICVEMFREPVSLPCKHSYCRQCLLTYASQAQDITGDTPPEETEPTRLACPLCRAETELGVEGVAGLPVNVVLAGVVGRGGTESVHETPMCSMCEPNNKSAAIKFCCTCDVLYCGECLSALHPMRGPLKRHSLVAVDEYIAQGMGEGRCLGGEDGENPAPFITTCGEHGEKLTDYCFTCHALICDQCKPRHQGHQVQDVGLPSAVKDLKAYLSEKAKEFVTEERTLVQCKKEIQMFMEDVKGKEELHLEEIDKAYRTTDESLKKWRQNLKESVRERHRDWRVMCEAGLSNLEKTVQQTKDVSRKMKNLFSTDDLGFLQVSVTLTNRKLDNYLSDVRDQRAVLDNIMQINRQAMDLDRVHAKAVLIAERFGTTLLSTPLLTFEEIPKGVKKIDQHGSCITDDGSCYRHSPFEAFTGHDLRYTNSYWELEVSFGEDEPSTTSKSGQHKGTFIFSGVAMYFGYRYGSFTDSKKTQRGVRIEYECKNYTCYILGDCEVGVHRGYLGSQSHKLGFYFDFYRRTLTVIDCNNDSVVCSIPGIDVAQKLTPVVDLSTGFTVRLVPSDCSTLPRVLRSILAK